MIIVFCILNFSLPVILQTFVMGVAVKFEQTLMLAILHKTSSRCYCVIRNFLSIVLVMQCQYSICLVIIFDISFLTTWSRVYSCAKIVATFVI